MIKLFTYWNNKKVWHEDKLFECVAGSITEADKLFTEATGHDASKNTWIGCTLDEPHLDDEQVVKHLKEALDVHHQAPDAGSTPPHT